MVDVENPKNSYFYNIYSKDAIQIICINDWIEFPCFDATKLDDGARTKIREDVERGITENKTPQDIL